MINFAFAGVFIILRKQLFLSLAGYSRLIGVEEVAER